jgi:hypothetical protein
MTTRTNSIIYFVCIFLFFFLLNSCQPTTSNQPDTINTTTAKKEKTETEKYQEWVENNPTETDKSEVNDEIDGSLYRNNKYKFRMRFHENWTFRKGDGKSTVIKSVQADSGKSISVIIEDFPNFKLQNKVLSQPELEERKQQFIEVMRLQNTVPTNLQMKNGYLNNFPATIITFNTIARSQDIELDYFHKQIHCIKDGKLYNISVSMPDAFFDSKENKRLYRVIESFVFEKGM